MRFLAVLILTSLVAACSRTHTVLAEPARKPQNVLLVTIDSLRPDRVGAYGDAEAHTPVLDALAAGGIRFDRAYATAPLTLPSHASLLSGRYPPHDAAHFDGQPVRGSAPLLAETLHRQGFATAAFVGTPALDPRFGLNRGFDTYEVSVANHVDSRADTWLEAHKELRVFVWAQLCAPHAPYGNLADRARVARPAIERYDDDVAEADAQLGRLIAALGPRRAETLVVVTSDNGEAFGEHGEIMHGLFVYDTTLRVPLVLNGPSLDRGRVVTDPVSLVDVATTITSLAGLPPYPSDGVSLIGPQGGTHARVDRTIYAESYAPLAEFGWSPLRSIRRGDWKYIEAPHPELYDLKNDPGETRNVIDDQPVRAAELAGEMTAFAPAQGPGHPGLADPKDRREIAMRIAEVTSGELQGPLLERVLREIIRDDPGNGIANLRLAEILGASGRCGEAVRRFRSATDAHAPADGIQRGLARCHAQKAMRGSR